MKAVAHTAILGPLHVCSAALTHAGKIRPTNEDNLLDLTEVGLWVVADGMGGHRRGADASAAIVRTLEAVPIQDEAPALLTEVKLRLDAVNRELLEQAVLDGGPIASTVVCLLIHGWSFACVWAGDSRLYLLRDGRLHRISHDHSVVQDLLDSGALTPDQAATHPHGNEVTRAVGAYDALDLDVRQGRVQPGDLFLLCSDGLTKMVRDDEIPGHLGEGTTAGSPEDVVESLLAVVLERGAIDNVAIVAVRCATTPDAADDGDTQAPRRPAAGEAGSRRC